MMDWLYNIWASLTIGRVMLGVGLFVISLTLSFLAIGLVLVKVPQNFFSRHYQRIFCRTARGLCAGVRS